MCRPASMIVLKDRVVWGFCDGHEELIERNKLCESGVRGTNLVRVEITPPGGDYSASPDKWVYCLDQDLLPDWYEPKGAEARVRKALEDWLDARVFSQGRHVLDKPGTFWAYDSASVKACEDSSTVCIYNSSKCAPKGPKAVVIDRSGNKAVCIVGE